MSDSLSDIVVLKPFRLPLVCRIVAAVTLVVFGVLAVLIGHGTSSEGHQFTVGDQVSFFLIGVLIAVGTLALTRFRVEADERAVRVRNVLGERSFPWQVVIGIHLDDGAPWAQLELQDDETVSLLALQANDRDRAIDGVLALRKLLAASRAG